MPAKEKAVKKQCSVLIVDPSEENREVLATALARRGVRTIGTDALPRGTQLTDRLRPDLIVIDLEMDEAAGRDAAEELDSPEQSPRSESAPPMILLGGIKGCRRRFPRGEHVPKPYHYGPLIRRIEELLAASRRPG